jgi:hypothetical protein
VIRLTQTKTEFLLQIPAAQKERAKRIQGRRWDPKRVCWVYPKTARILEELVAEFGDDLTSVPAIRPSHVEARSAQSQLVQEENRFFKQELAKIHQQLDQISRSADARDAKGLAELQATLASLESQRAEAQLRLEQTQTELAETRQALHNARAQVSRLRGLLEDKRSSPSSNFETIVKEKAVEATGDDHKFIALASTLKLDETLPIGLASRMEEEIRKLLDTSDRDLDLYGLLVQAQDAEALPPDALDLAHLIRKQRNIVAHGRAYKKTHVARVLMSLFAAALLWPEFLED